MKKFWQMLVVVCLVTPFMWGQGGTTKVPALSGNNTWTGKQTFNGGLAKSGATGNKCLKTDASGNIVEFDSDCSTGSDPNAVKVTGDQTVSGTKTFTTPPVISGTPTADTDADTVGARNTALAAIPKGINGVIDVTAAPYNAKCDGTTNDLAAFKSALAAAIAAGKALYVPAGTCVITFANSAGNTSLNITGTVKIFGAGRDLTTLKFLPDPPTFAYNGFYLKGTGDATISDMTLQGNASNTGGYGGTVTAAVMTEMNTSPWWTGTLTLRNLKVTNKWYVGVYSSNGPSTVTLDYVDVTGYEEAVIMYNGLGHERYFNVSNSWIHDGGIVCTEPNTSGLDRGHTLYMHPNISTKISNTLFSNTTNYCSDGSWLMKMYASSTPSTNAKYVLLDNVAFIATGTKVAGLYYAGAKAGNPAMRLSNCYISGNAIDALSVGWDMDVDNCAAVSSSLTTPAIKSWSFTGKKFNFSNGYVYGTTALGSDNTTCPSCASEWTIRNTEFDGGTVAATDTQTSTARIVLRGNIFRYADKGIINPGSAAMWDIKDNTFIGANVNYYVITPTSLPTVILEGNKFLGTGPLFDSANMTNGKLTGSDNYVQQAGGANIFRPSGPPSKQGLIVRRGLKATTVASAANLSLGGFNWDTFHVTGTATIDNIYFDSGTTGSNAYFGGSRVCLIADGAWTTSAAGNIIPLVATARTVNQMACFVYDSTAAKWYEQ